MYRVITDFADMQDANYVYKVGDTFPRAGVRVTEERAAELASNKNRRGCPLIELVEEEKVTVVKKRGKK